ncbi:MAG: 3-hydroxyacyl-CoA dehydrogenase NAD-binding domain-containing protein [Gemmatimonadota bacterium]|jgi:3-hydroxyacyl-CoA dehydrogenase
MSQPARFERIDGVGVVTLDNPPVNALSLELRTAIRDAFQEGLDDADVEAFVLTGGGRMFSAGADITEFDSGRSNEPPTLRDLIDLIEDSGKPVVAAMHGNAMGGGLELPLACHARVATSGTRVGLPEVNIGIVPGAGGTQRLPRLVGVKAALDIIVTGKPIPAEKAEKIGLVDEVVPAGGDLVAAGVALAKKLAAADSPPPKTRDRDAHLAEARENPSVFDDYRKSIARRARGYEAPFACIDCVQASVEKPFEEGVDFERDTFQRLRTSDQAKALRHVFFAERQASKVSGVDADTAEYPIRKATVLGCGTMGGGIAMCFANAGIPVTVREHDQAALDRGMDIIRKNYAATVSKGRMSQEAMDACMALITPTLEMDVAAADADIVIEAVFENMDLKKEIFTQLHELCSPDTVLATNTSSLDVNEIASVTSRPEQVLGTHFFSPANVMKLLEIVRAEKTSPEALKTVMSLSKRIGKVGVVVGVCDSFAANRSLYAYTRQAGFLIEEGALPEQVDRVIYEFGFPMGPFAVGDLAGIDVGYKIRQHRGRPEGKRYSDIADKLYEMDRYGQKTRKGWYRYEEGSRTPIPDPEVTELIIQTSKDLGIERREISDEEILQRCMYPMINEGARILEEGIVERASDFDLVWLYGYGFPRYRGGPMFWADQLGLDHVYEKMLEFYEKDPDWLEPAPLLAKLAKEGGTFGGWSGS